MGLVHDMFYRLQVLINNFPVGHNPPGDTIAVNPQHILLDEKQLLSIVLSQCSTF